MKLRKVVGFWFCGGFSVFWFFGFFFKSKWIEGCLFQRTARKGLHWLFLSVLASVWVLVCAKAFQQKGFLCISLPLLVSCPSLLKSHWETSLMKSTVRLGQRLSRVYLVMYRPHGRYSFRTLPRCPGWDLAGIYCFFWLIQPASLFEEGVTQRRMINAQVSLWWRTKCSLG